MMLSNTLVHSSGVKSFLLAMAVSNERSVLATYFCCLITSKFAPPGRVAFRAWTTGMRPRLSARYGSRPCTHKSRLVSSGWSLSALPPKADIRQRIEQMWALFFWRVARDTRQNRASA
jgi:hypothetical protein